MRAFPRADHARRCAGHSRGTTASTSHIAWERNIEERFGVGIPFPIITDLSTKAAPACGMIQPGENNASAVRDAFVIDPQGKPRAMVCYSMSQGRSIPETLRLVEATQTSRG